MEIKPYSKLDISLYSEVLDNGLTIYVVPIKKNNNIYATFSTKFGSRINEFVPINNDKMIKVPLGVAHFLEHKAFEQEDGIDPFSYFSERGASANANTTYDKTTYLFSGTEFLEENLNYLLDYVQKPYFTDENVEKEKGIIIQEYEMYQDKPFNRCYEGLIYNTFINDPVKYPIIGVPDSINSITKENLYDCYNTFYHPSNMFVVVTGNVDPEQVIDVVKKNQSKKDCDEFKKITTKKYKEPNKVEKKYEEKGMNVTIPKVAVGYKVDISNLKKYEKRKIMNYLSLFLDITFGLTSKFNEKMRNENIIHGDVGIDYLESENHILLIVLAESNKYKEFIKFVDDEVKNINISKEELERKKKSAIGAIVALSDNIYSINSTIMNHTISYGHPNTNAYEFTESLNIDEMNEIISKISFENSTVYVVKPK